MNRRPRSGKLYVAGALSAMLLPAGCQPSDGAQDVDVVDVSATSLTLNEERLDPPAGGSVTACTIGGVTMHCCPEWQTGRLHYVMIGMNLSTNTFRCARLPNFSGNSAEVTLAPQGSTFQDSREFNPVCPGTKAMVGYHFGLKRVACAGINDPNPIVAYVDTTQPINGMKTCHGNFVPGGSNNAAMNGVSVTNPSTIFRCIH